MSQRLMAFAWGLAGLFVSRIVVSILLFVLAIAGGVSGFGFLASLSEPPARRIPTARPLIISTYQVSLEDVREIISVFGTSRADREVQLTAQVAGQIVDTYKLNIGENVEAPTAQTGTPQSPETSRYPGDVIITIDPKSYQEKLLMAQSQLGEDEAERQKILQQKINLENKLSILKESLETYRREFQRVDGLYQNGRISESERDRSRLEMIKYEESVDALESELALIPKQLEQLNQRINSHNSDVQMAQLDIDRTKVVPSFSGTISDVFVELGQYIRIGDALVKIVDHSHIEIPVAISIEDHARIYEQWVQKGSIPVAIARQQNEPAIWNGEISRFAPVADERTRTVEVFVVLENEAQKTPLMPGTFVNVRIESAVQKQILMVPRSAIVDNTVFVYEAATATPSSPTPDPDGNPLTESTLKKPSDVRKATVSISGYIQGMAVIDEGLEPGDQIIITNLDLLNELLTTNEAFTLLPSDVKTARQLELDQRIRRWQLLSSAP